MSILGDDEGLSSFLVIQHSSGLADRQILVANVFDSGDDPDFGRGPDRVDGSREGNLKTTGDANGGLSVSTDGRKTESEERQREHSGAGNQKAVATGMNLAVDQPPNTPSFYTSWNVRDSAAEVQTNPRGSIDQHDAVGGNRACYLISDIVRSGRIVNSIFQYLLMSSSTATGVSYNLANESYAARCRRKVHTDPDEDIERAD